MSVVYTLDHVKAKVWSSSSRACCWHGHLHCVVLSASSSLQALSSLQVSLSLQVMLLRCDHGHN